MKITKTILTLSLGFLTLTNTTSCVNNWLEVTPGDRVEDNGKAVTTTADLEGLRTGMYAALKGSSSFTDYYGREMFYAGDLRGEDLQANIKGNNSNRATFYYLMAYNNPSQFSGGQGIWQSPYIVISRANRIIKAAEDGSITDQAANTDEVAQYEAEAKVLRGMALFDLTRLYGKTYTEDQGASLGVPITTSVEDKAAFLKRNTVKEDYTQVLKDLTEAINSGKLATTKTQGGYMNLWAAKALLTRVYLTMGDNTNALKTAEEVINNNAGYKLWTREQYADAWLKTNGNHENEMLFEFVVTSNKDWNDREGIAYGYGENALGGYGDVVATKSFITMLQSDPKDVRNKVFYAAQDKANYDKDPKSTTDYGVYKDTTVFLNKMPAVDGDFRYSNVPILRLSEVYLSAAEAAFKLGQKGKAAQYLNEIISNRTSDSNKLVNAGNITLDRIKIERRKELVGEGQRFFDAMRNDETIVRYTSPVDKGWHDDLDKEVQSYNRTSTSKVLLAIPQDEMDANPSLKGQQNPGYGE